MSDDDPPPPHTEPVTLEGQHEAIARPKNLTDFLDLKGAKASHLVADINSAKVSIQKHELDAVTSRAARRPELLSKILDFVRSATAKSGPAREVGTRLALQSVQTQDDGLADWPAFDTGDEALARVARWARIRLMGNDQSFRQKGEDVLALALLYLLQQRVLDPVLVLRQIAFAYGHSRTAERADATRSIIKLLRKAKPSQLGQFAQIAQLQDAAVAEATQRLAEETQRVVAAQSEVTTLQGRIQALNSELQAARDATVAERLESSALREKLESAHRLGAHDVGDLRARYKRIFVEEIRPIAIDAMDAVEIGKTEFVKDYVQQLNARVEREVEWLNSSSE